MTQEMKTQLVILEAVVLAIYNQPSTFVRDVYGMEKAEGGYFNEKVKVAIQSFGRWWGELDWSHRERAVEVAMELYGDEALRRVEGN